MFKKLTFIIIFCLLLTSIGWAATCYWQGDGGTNTIYLN